MAKSTKVEDYWRQHNIESLFKELTQYLVRRMPPDPAIAIVEHIKKKFPQSFKTSTEDTANLSKTLGSNLQLHSMTTTRSGLQNESINDLQSQRRLSQQSQTSGPIKIPTIGSAFTDLLKQDTTSLSQAPELNIRNLVFANRLTQQVVKMGKDIRSDRDILEEEVIKPIETKLSVSPTSDLSVVTISEDSQRAESYEIPSVTHLIKYKQQIRTENDRRLHREKLAELAKMQREKEQFIDEDDSSKSGEIQSERQQQQQQQTLSHDTMLSQVVPTKKIHTKLSSREEEILNDENIFRRRRHQYRARGRDKLVTSRSNTPHLPGHFVMDLRSTMKRDNGNLVCKTCGHIINGQDRVSTTPTKYPAQPRGSARSFDANDDVVDDWFQPTSDRPESQQLTSSLPKDTMSSTIGSNIFRQNLFQPIKDDNNDSVERSTPVEPLNTTDNEAKVKRLKTPRISESGIFSRSPEPKRHSPSSLKVVPSPSTTKNLLDTDVFASHRSPKTVEQPSSLRSTPLSTILPKMPLTKERRMSGWSVCENSPDDSDES